MRAAVVKTPGPAESLEIVDVPDPVPAQGELSIDVEFAGVGFVDTLFRAGVFALPTPFVPGIEVSGRVREVGAGVTGFAVGQPVGALLNDFGRGPRAGGYAEIAVAHASMAVPLPEGADLAGVAGVLVNGVTAWMALHDLARLGVDDDVLVLGASGGLGNTISRLAAVRPARRVIGVVGSEARRASAAEECTDVIVAADLAAAVDELTDGRGVDVVVDPVGGELRTRAFERLAPFGRLLVLGNASGRDPALSGDAVWHGTRQLIGLSLGTVAHLVPEQVQTAISAVVGSTHRGVLREPAPSVVPLEDVAGVHRALENRSAPPKTVLAVGR
ncbi:quinone oxidoreductase family protein [Actinoallomurus iriomotensis]|uniref:NADPH:quinone reductase n=1 Tax=Actinoallomurus iriomotensis TaxID=478107 RepID=A0A9W6RSS9_9ACTN|nr:zinc-binding dehydrogenase [Actinoallomurus iriomotensis]GLY81241.1 NADPH:quinone reductase [Actinoallomurus iriomotensis]